MKHPLCPTTDTQMKYNIELFAICLVCTWFLLATFDMLHIKTTPTDSKYIRVTSCENESFTLWRTGPTLLKREWEKIYYSRYSMDSTTPTIQCRHPSDMFCFVPSVVWDVRPGDFNEFDVEFELKMLEDASFRQTELYVFDDELQMRNRSFMRIENESRLSSNVLDINAPDYLRCSIELLPTILERIYTLYGSVPTQIATTGELQPPFELFLRKGNDRFFYVRIEWSEIIGCN